ncbi:acyltransferase [Phenylobacterium sp.]|uniref:acyltransferase n=1 Tax=Phenylobacterium sp. TaxID=1871053 RepID=UPI0011F4FF3B|nr:acyltransferase [Phenylobacterium sp.]THD58445.1 MAG: acyltransferase [Phenylobacterium sp.]
MDSDLPPGWEVHPSTVLDLKSDLKGRVRIEGLGCRIVVGANVTFEATIRIFPGVTDAVVEVGDNCSIGGVIRLVRGDGGLISIGEDTTFNQVGLSMHERGRIVFGRDCMLSTDIHMDPSDMHPIFDRVTGQRLNPPQDIEIGDHVWLGTRVLVLKGARIGDGAIVGAGSIVSGVLPPNTLSLGSPARVVRENVAWTREFDASADMTLPPGDVTVG